MRIWNFWINTLISSIEYHPPRFVELLMLMLAIPMLIISIIIRPRGKRKTQRL